MPIWAPLVIRVPPSRFHLPLSVLALHPVSPLSFSLLSCFHSSPLIPPVSSPPTFRSPFYTFPRLLTLLTAYQRAHCLNREHDVTLKNNKHRFLQSNSHIDFLDWNERCSYEVIKILSLEATAPSISLRPSLGPRSVSLCDAMNLPLPSLHLWDKRVCDPRPLFEASSYVPSVLHCLCTPMHGQQMHQSTNKRGPEEV